jgi:hypothetical protein
MFGSILPIWFRILRGLNSDLIIIRIQNTGKENSQIAGVHLLYNSVSDPTHYYMIRIRVLILRRIKLMQICDQRSTNPPWFLF